MTTQTEKAEAMVALLRKCEHDLAQVKAEQAEARQQRERLTSTLDFLKQCEAAGQRAARQRRRATLTKRYGPILFTD